MLGLAAALRGTGARDNQAPFSEAERLLKQVLDREPKNIAALFNLGVLYSDYMKRPLDGKPLLKKFLSYAPQTHPSRPAAEKLVAAAK